MDPIRNPYKPGAGKPPPFLAGRQEIQDLATFAIERLKVQKSAKSFIAFGLRGVGKTVILRHFYNQTKMAGFEVSFTEATDNIDLRKELVSLLRSMLLRISGKDKISYYMQEAIGALKSFARIRKISYQDFAVEIDPQEGSSDSGDLNSDLPELLEKVGLAAKEKKTAIILIIDEIQYLPKEQLSALIMALHRCDQQDFPVLLFGGGLPQILAKMGNAKSYAERLFEFREIGPLAEEDAKNALEQPAQAENSQYQPDALSYILNKTKGYPYFLQEWGHAVWESAESSPFSLQNAHQAEKLTERKLDKGFFRVRLDRTTPLEQNYMHAMADLGDKPHRSGDIAKKLGLNNRSASPIRSRLIEKGMIYSPHHGDTAFTVPLFDAFMRREKGNFTPHKPKKRSSNTKKM